VNQSSTVDLIVRFAQPLKAFRAVDQAAKKTNQTLEKTQDVLRKVTEASRGVKASVEATQQSLPKLSQVQGVLAAKVRNSEQAMRSQIKALRDLQVRVKFNGSLYNKLGAEISKYEQRLRSANSATDDAKGRFSGLAAGLGKLAVAFGAARAAQATLQAGIRRDESERRLRLLTERFGETAEAQEAAQRAADKFNLSQTEANVQLSRLIARLRPMGLSMATIETAFAGFNTATILAGATASESAGAFLQLSQALGSGVLRGQELNSILEQAPLIAQAIALEMGVAVGALKKLGEEGEITSEIVIAALGRVERDGADQLTEALKGPAASIKDFQNAAEEVQVALTQDIIPEMARSFRELAGIIEDLGPLLRFIGGGVGGALSLAREGISALTFEELRDPKGFAEKRIREGKVPSPFAVRSLIGEDRAKELGDLARDAVMFGGRFEGLGSRDKVLAELLQKEIGMFAAPGRPETVESKTQPTKKTAAQLRKEEAIALREFLALNKLMTLEKDRQDELNEMAGKHLAFQLNEADKISLNQDQRLGKLQAQINGTEEEFALNQAIEEIKRKGLLPADEERLINAEMQIHAMDKQAKLLADQKQLAEEVGQTIKNGIGGAIMSALDGSKSLSESLSGILRQLGGMFLNRGIGSFKKQDGTGGSGLLGMFANGGRPPVGRPSIVGERGPELFVPDRAGTIIPNNQLGGSTSVVVNVDASGTEVQGNQGNADQLGRLIGQAVQAELIKQKRPGGLLTR
jgi:tape measure domain-containing protein